MVNRLLTLCLIFMLCVNSSFAQKRKKIDRTGQEEKNTSTTFSSKSSSTSSSEKPTTGNAKTSTSTKKSTASIKKTTGNSTKTTASNKPVQQSYLRVSSQSANFEANGGTQKFIISSNDSWTISVNTASWGHLTRTGNTLTLKVDANTGPASRTDHFVIRAGNLEKRINILQSAQTTSTSSSVATATNSNANYAKTSSSATAFNQSTYSSSNYSYRNRRRKFNHAQDNFCGGFSVGYIQKQWTYEENREKEKFGVFDDDKYLQGIQAGIRIDPQFGSGFGMNSGLFYEYCWAKSNDIYDSYGTYHLAYDEHGLYLPLHLKFTMNFSKWLQLSFYGGLGSYYALSGQVSIRDNEETYESENVFSEEDNWKRFNMMLEYGLSIRINALQIDFTQSQGLNNWSDTDGVKIKQGRPLSISATICF